MKSEFDKIKKIMSEENPPLPPELDWEQMEGGIRKKMDKLKTPSQKGYSSNKIITLLTGITLGILLLPMLCTPSKENIQSSLPAVSRVQSDKVHRTPNPTNGISNTLNALPSSSTGNAFDDDIHDNNNNAVNTEPPATRDAAPGNLDLSSLKSGQNNHTNAANRPDPLHLRKDPSHPNTSLKQETVNETPVNNGPNATIVDEKNEITFSPRQAFIANDTMESLATLHQQNHRFRPPLKTLPPSGIYVVTQERPFILPQLNQGLPENSIPVKNTSKNPGRLTFLSGISAWDMGYGSTKPERDPYESTITSYYGGINYIHTQKKNYTFLIGLQFQQLENRFDWNTALEDHTITLTDTVLQIQTNALTGQTSQVRGNIQLSVPAKRNIRHYNKIQLIQIPFAVGKTWTFKSWQTDVLVGGALSVFSHHKGRTVYDNEVYDYSGTTTNFVSNQWQFNTLLMGRLTYKFNERFGITTGIQLEKSLSNWSTEANTRMRPGIISWALGVNYYL